MDPEGGYGVGGRGLNPLEYQTVMGLLSDTGHPWISQNFQDSILDVRPSLVHQQNAIKMALLLNNTTPPFQLLPMPKVD